MINYRCMKFYTEQERSNREQMPNIFIKSGYYWYVQSTKRDALVGSWFKVP